MLVELIGFDNEKKDLNVAAFLDQVGFVPHGISLLLWDSDFVHSHCGLSEDGLLGEKQCSYGAHPYNEERQRQREGWGQTAESTLDKFMAMTMRIKAYLDESWRNDDLVLLSLGITCINNKV